MAIYREDILDIELASGSLHRSFLNHAIGMGDSAANRFGVRVFRNGEPESLSSVTCQGYFRNSHGENIALTSYGTVSDNVAYVTLPQACYNYEGQFTLAIKLVGGGVTGTMRIIDGMVDNTNTSSAVAPTGSVPTYQEVLSVFEQMQDALEDYDETVATQNAQISDLKSALDISEENSFNFIVPTWKLGTVTSEGVIGESTNRIITDKHIFVKAGSSIGLDDYTNYKIGVAIYHIPTVYGFDEYVGFSSLNSTYVFENDCYIVPTCAYVDNRTIAQSQISSLTSHVVWKVFDESALNSAEKNSADINTLERDVYGSVPVPGWQLGAINSSTGEITTVTNRIVTANAMPAMAGSTITLTDSTNYKMAIAVYQANGGTYRLTEYHAFTEGLTSFSVDKNCYIRVVLAYVGDYILNTDYMSEYTKNVVLKIVSGNGIYGSLGELGKAINGDDIGNRTTSTDWMLRGINSQDGSIVLGVNNRITTKWFLHAKAGSTISLDNFIDYNFGIAKYADETVESFISYVGFAVNTSPVTIDSDCYIMITMRFASNQAIQTIDGLAQHLILNIINVDETDGLINNEQYIHNMLSNDLSLIHRNYHGKKQYRIHVDEVIWALWDLVENNYESIFDQSEFADYKRIHDAYGAVFVLSLHYKQQSGIAWRAPFPQEMIGWTIEEVPTTWRNEFIANSDWLKFSFHAYAYEYRYEPGSTDRPWEQDIIDMREQVVRFAGEECWIDEFVKTHGVVGDQALVRIFMNQGAKYFEGDAEHVERTDPVMQTYYLTDEQQDKMFADGTYYDPTNKALFIAGAGNLERLYGFVGGTRDMDYYLDNYVWNPSYTYKKRCNYMTFCSHESPMLGGMVIVVNGVTTGDSIVLNGTTYTAGTDFAVGANDAETATNLYNVLGSSIIKYMKSSNQLTIYGTLGNKSDSFYVRTPMQQIELTAKWCYENGWVGHHLDEDSFYKW